MREKIELNQSDMLKLYVEKINFLTLEYVTLYKAFKHDRGKINVDPLIITESYQRFLTLQGDLSRLNQLYYIFDDDKKNDNDKN